MEEIRRSPVDMENVSLFPKVSYIQIGCWPLGISEASSTSFPNPLQVIHLFVPESFEHFNVISLLIYPPTGGIQESHHDGMKHVWPRESQLLNLHYFICDDCILIGGDTSPKTNIVPEKWWLQDEFPFGVRHIFWCELFVSGRVDPSLSPPSVCDCFWLAEERLRSVQYPHVAAAATQSRKSKDFLLHHI